MPIEESEPEVVQDWRDDVGDGHHEFQTRGGARAEPVVGEFERDGLDQPYDCRLRHDPPLCSSNWLESCPTSWHADGDGDGHGNGDSHMECHSTFADEHEDDRGEQDGSHHELTLPASLEYGGGAGALQ